jgi:hypothetical protein
MSRRFPRKATNWERDYIRQMERVSAFEMVDRGQAKILSFQEYPEPLKRFIRRERVMVHVRLPVLVKRKLEERSRETGIPMDELARRWIVQGIQRDAG